MEPEGNHRYFRLCRAVLLLSAFLAGPASGWTEAVRAQESGLVLSYGFEEGSGTTVDSAPPGRTGTLFHTEWIPNARSGNGLSFNGSDSYAASPAEGLPAFNAPQTISFWVMTSGRAMTRQSVVTLLSRTQPLSLQIGFKDSMAGVWQRNGSWLVMGMQPSAGKWHHFAYTYDGQTHRFYVDGAESGSSTIAPRAAVADTFEIGRGWAESEYFRGSLDEVRIFDRALAPTEIQALLAAGAAAPNP